MRTEVFCQGQQELPEKAEPESAGSQHQSKGELQTGAPVHVEKGQANGQNSIQGSRAAWRNTFV